MNRARLAALALCVTTIGWLSAPSSPAVAAEACSGIVYDDLDIDGTHDPAEPGLDGIEIRVTPTRGAPLAVTTDDDGAWSISLADSAYPVRLEFDTPDPYRASATGDDNGTSIQFINSVTACSTRTAGNFGMYEPGAACAAPLVVTACFLSADAPHASDAPALQLIDLTTTDNRSVNGSTQSDWLSTTPTYLSSLRDVGSIYGLDTDHRGTIYAAGFVKRHTRVSARLNPTGNPTVIYRLRPGQDADVLAVIDPNATDPHGPIEADDYRKDPASFDDVYRTGLGDLDISRDGSTLFTIDLGRRELVSVALPSGRVDRRLPLTGATLGIDDCAVTDATPFGDLRAMGLGFDADHQLMIGVVCSAESTVEPGDFIDESVTQEPLGDPDQLVGYVFRLEGEQLVERLRWPLAVDRGETQQNGSISNDATWHPWVDGVPFADEHDVVSYPQPAITDITVDDAGNLIIALGDRFGHQTMPESSAPTTDGQTLDIAEVVTAGDLQRACPDGANWVIEGSAGCRGGWGDGFEFFSGDRYGWHAETALGSVIALPRSPTTESADDLPQRLLATQLNPVHDEDPWRSGGLAWHDSTTGEYLRGIRLYDGRNADPDFTFEKSSGIADLALLCDAAPLQVGGRIWYDADGDGEQDSDEASIPETVVELRNQDGVLLATTRSGPNGTYSFSDDNVDAGLADGAEYVITVAEWNFAHGPFSPSGRFVGLRSTLHDPSVDPELDSDGRPGAHHTTIAGLTMAPVVAGDDPATERIEGAVDHSIDFGMRDQYDLAVATRSMRHDEALGVLVFETVVHNQGSEPSGAFQVVTRLPRGVTVVAASRGATVAPGSRILEWTFSADDEFAPGEFRQLTTVVSVDDASQAPFVNSVQIVTDSGDDDDSTPGNTEFDVILDRTAAFREDGGLVDDNGGAIWEDDADSATVSLHQIVGRLWIDVDRDGDYEPDAPSDDPAAAREPAQAGVVVRLLHPDGVEIERRTTRFDGTYAFSLVPTGEYLIDIPAIEFDGDRPLHGYDWLSTDPEWPSGTRVNGSDGVSMSVSMEPPILGATPPVVEIDLGIGHRPENGLDRFITPALLLPGLIGAMGLVLLAQRRSNRAALLAG